MQLKTADVTHFFVAALAPMLLGMRLLYSNRKKKLISFPDQILSRHLTTFELTPQIKVTIGKTQKKIFNHCLQSPKHKCKITNTQEIFAKITLFS